MKQNGHRENIQLDYPCEWTYKVIGMQPEILQNIIQEVMQARRFTLGLSNTSKAKKYCSMKLVTRVESEADRNDIYQRLKKHPDVVMVL